MNGKRYKSYRFYALLGTLIVLARLVQDILREPDALSVGLAGFWLLALTGLGCAALLDRADRLHAARTCSGCGEARHVVIGDCPDGRPRPTVQGHGR
jgi:hypothetical protein